MNPKKKFVHNNGVTRLGTVAPVIDSALFTRIRKRLGISKKKLPNKVIRKIILMSNTEIGNWIVENSEGYLIEIGFDKKKPMGVLSASKHLPKEFREDRDEKIEYIKTLKISEQLRGTILKRYSVDVGNAVDYKKLRELGELIPHLNLGTYFYKYRIIWFNQRNCITKKAKCYTFKPHRDLNKKMFNKIMEGKDYYEWNFHNLYFHKIKSEF